MEAGGVRSLVHLLLLFLLLPSFLLDEGSEVEERRHVRQEGDRSLLEEPGEGIRSIPPRLVVTERRGDNVSTSARVSHSLARIHSISQRILGRARQRKKELLARRLTTAINSRRQVKTFLSTTERTRRELGTRTPVEILSSTGPPTVFEADESTETTTLDPGLPTTSDLLLAFLKPAETIIPRRLEVSFQRVDHFSRLYLISPFLVPCHLQVAHIRTV